MPTRILPVRIPRTGGPDTEIEVADRAVVATKPARLRASQPLLAALPSKERCKIMAHWAVHRAG